MPFDMEIDDDFEQRRLQRLEQRFRRAQFVLIGAQAAFASLRSMPGVNPLQLLHGAEKVQRAQQQLIDAQSAIEFLEDERATPALLGAD